MTTKLSSLIWLGCILFVSSITAHAELYSDYQDFELAGGHHINRIGDIGDLKTVVDLRGFMPIYGLGRLKNPDGSPERSPVDGHIYPFQVPGVFKVPTKVAIGVIYYGKEEKSLVWADQVEQTPMKKMDNVNIILEKEL